MTLPGLVRANNLNDVVDRERAWDNLGSSLATGDIAIPAPSLDLNFAANKSLIDDISGNNLITFSRASTATFVGSNGLIQTAASGVARFDHDPATGESLGLLVEEARTNLVTYSEQFDQWFNGSTTTITTNTTTAPDGTSTADKVIPTAASAVHYVMFTTAQGVGTFTFSVYAKAAGYPRLGIQVWDGAAYQMNTTFDVSAGTIVNNSAGTAKIESVGNGWYRCSCTGTTVTGSMGSFPAYWNLQSLPASATAQAPFTGDGTSGTFMWGAQIEAGSFPTSYIPTVASTVTRAADVASITGANFSSWYNQSEGSVFCDGISNSTSSSTYYSLQGSGAYAAATVLVFPSNFITMQVYDASLYVNIALGSYPSVSKVKSAIGLKANNFAGVINGGTVVTDVSGALPAADSLILGNYTGGSTAYDYSGTISRLAYWPSRLNNKALQYITQPSINTINLYSFSYSVTGKEVLALNAVRNTSTRDFIFIKGLLSSVQPRLTAASQNTSSGVLLDSFAMPKLAPTTIGNYFFSTGLALSGVTTRINGTNARSIATSPFSGSTATAPLLFRELRPQANWRITEPMVSGTIASPSLAIPFETNDFVLFIKAGQN